MTLFFFFHFHQFQNFIQITFKKKINFNMNSVRWERRRTSFLSSGHRSITNRPSIISPDKPEANLTTNTRDIQETPPPVQQEPAKPIKIKKKELMVDPKASLFIQFSKTVKNVSNIILRSIGTNRKDLKPALNEAYDLFFADFDSWWKNKYHTSQRKDTSSLNIDVLKRQLNDCNSSIKPLRDQYHKWKMYKDYNNIKDIYVPLIEIQQIEMPSTENSDEVKSKLKIFVNGMASISLYIQNTKSEFYETVKYKDEISKLLQFKLQIDYKKQLTLRNQLTDDVST